jgi:hypothetical protein
VVRELVLRIVTTPGGTPDPAVNRIHVEARLGRLLRFRLWVQRITVADYFNERIAPRLAEAARLIE